MHWTRSTEPGPYCLLPRFRPPAQGPYKPMCLCLFSLCCCCSTASHMPLQAQYYLWRSRYNNSRAMISLLCVSHRWRVCVMFVRLCMRGGFAATKSVYRSSEAAAVQRQPCFKLSRLAFVPVVTVYVVCGWCTADDRTTTTFSHSMQQSNTSSDLMPGIREHTAVAKAVAHTNNWNAYVPPL